MNKNLRTLSAMIVVATATMLLPVDAKAYDSNATYYYTTDGSTPSATNGTKLTGTTITLDAPDTDAEKSVVVKVVAVRSGYTDSDVATTVVTYGASTTINLPTTSTTLTVTLNKSEVPNGYTGAIAMISNRETSLDYYYTLDGSTPTPSNGTKLTQSYINISAPSSTSQTLVTVNVMGYKDGVASTDLVSQVITFDAYVSNQFNVSFRDRTYSEISSVTVAKGGSAESVAPTPPAVDGYSFVGWSENIADIEGNMIVRALYEKNTTTASSTSSPSYYVVNNGSTGDSYVEIGGATPGSTIKVYLDAVSDTPCFTGTADSNGEAEITIPVGNLDDADGQVYVDIEAPTSSSTEITDLNEGVLMADAISLSSSARTSVKYASRAVSQSTSQPILASRMTMTSGTNLEVRGIAAGEIVKVYDVDNNLIGQATQSVTNQVMDLTLSKDMSTADVYASRTTSGLLESPETELTKDVVSAQITASSTNQTVTNAKLLIDNAISNMAVSNATVKSDVQTLIDSAIINSNITGTIQSDFNVIQATDTTDGSVTGTISLLNSSDGSVATCSISRVITKLSAAQTIAQAKSIIDQNISNYTAINSSSQSDFLSALKNGITDSSIGVTLNSYVITPATSTTTGLLTATIIVSKPGYSSIEIDVTNKSIPQTGSVAQTNTQAQTAVTSKVSTLTTSNTTTEEELLNDIKDAITDSSITVTTSNFKVVSATSSSTGLVSATVTLTRTDGSVYSFPVSSIISKLGDTTQTASQLATLLQNAQSTLNVTNDSTEASIVSDLSKLITNPNLELRIDNFSKDSATSTSTGLIKGKIVIVDTSQPTGTTTVSTQSIDEAKNSVDNVMSNLTASNSTTEDYLQYKAEKVVSDNIDVDIQNYDITPATTTTPGALTWEVDLKDSTTTGASVELEYDKTIAKGLFDNGESLDESSNPIGSASSASNETYLALNVVIAKLQTSTTGSTTSGSSSSTTTNTSTSSDGSSSGGSGGGGGGGSASATTTTTVTPTTSSGSENTTTEDITSILNIIKNVSSGLSTGASTQVTNSDGSTDSITQLLKNGVYYGSVISSGSSGSRSVSIGSGIDESSLSTVYVYKYVPQISKFILVQSNVSVNSGTISLSTEKDSNYYVTVSPLDSTVLAKVGWNSDGTDWFFLSNDNKLVTGWKKDGSTWYFLDQLTAKMKTGWSKDGATWYLLSSNGAMQTGWVQDNGNWYHLSAGGALDMDTWIQEGINWYYVTSSGAMAVGWALVGDTWYYFNADGSMAYSTVIYGYTLGANGTLV